LFKVRAQVRDSIIFYGWWFYFYDVVEKMNDMLMACVRIKWDGRMGSYLELKIRIDYFLIFQLEN
jgi:hypothetical protein